MADKKPVVLGPDGRPRQIQTGDTVGVAAGGTGQVTAYAAKDALTVQGADIASAGTTNLATATGEYVHVTGTTTITALGTATAGVERVVKFAGVLTLTHNATSLQLPGGVSITTAADDRAIFRSLGSGNWICIAYVRAAMPPGGVTAADAASDTTTWVMLAGSQTGSQAPLTDAGITYNASTNTLSTSVSGNATTATTLQTARALNGVNFDGSAAITVPTLVSSVNAGIGRGYIDGLITSRASTTTVTVGIGVARDSTDAHFIYLSAATTKTLQSSGAWAAGTGNNGLDTGARANSTWYHVWAISQAAGASPDVLFSTSATSPTMPSTYTLKRRIACVRTDGSGNILQWDQYGDEFYWDTAVADVTATNPGTSAVTRTLTVPTGVRVKAILSLLTSVNTVSSSCPGSFYVSDLATADLTGGVSPYAASHWHYHGTNATQQMGANVMVWTNTSAQVRSRVQVSSTETNTYITTLGWIDPRGKNE